MQVQLVIFSAQKDGCSPAEWEDGAGGGSFGRGHGGDPPCARFAVADGATETYDSAALGQSADRLVHVAGTGRRDRGIRTWSATP